MSGGTYRGRGERPSWWIFPLFRRNSRHARWWRGWVVIPALLTLLTAKWSPHAVRHDRSHIRSFGVG